MKTVIFTMALVMVSTVALADKVMSKHEYIGAISCKTQINPDKPAAGECSLIKRIYEVGTNITRQGDVCTKTTVELVALNRIQVLNHEIIAPDLNTTKETTKCGDFKSTATNVTLHIHQ